MTTRFTTTFNSAVDALIHGPSDRYGYEAAERRYWDAYNALSQRDLLEHLPVETLVDVLDELDARRSADLDAAYEASRAHLDMHGWA